MARQNIRNIEVLEKLDKLAGDLQQSELEFRIFIQRYLLACARAIWKLLPGEGSRRGIEGKEQELLGLASDKNSDLLDYHSEADAFLIDYSPYSSKVKKWVEEIKQMPREELDALIHPPGTSEKYRSREILKRAAYFADFALSYTNLVNISGEHITSPIPEIYWIFLSPKVLDEMLAS